MEVLGFGVQLGKIEVLATRTRPIGHKDLGVHPCQLSIKLDGEGEDIDKDVWVEEAMHPQCTCKQRGLGKVLMLRQGEEGLVEVAIRQENSGVFAQMGSKGEDPCNGSKSGGKSAVMACAEPAFDAYPI